MDDFSFPVIDQATNEALDTRIRSIYDPMKYQGDVQGLVQAKKEQNPFVSQQGDAISRKYEKMYLEPALKEQAVKQQVSEVGSRLKRQNDIMGMQLDRTKYSLARMNAIQNRIMQEESQRAQVLSGILGVGFTVAGMAMAGPAGGLAGAGTAKATTSLTQPELGSDYSKAHNYTLGLKR